MTGTMSSFGPAFPGFNVPKGRRHDPAEDLIALPGNLQTFFVQPPQLPYQQGRIPGMAPQ